MIKATELMIGDWVIVHHPTMPAENIQISADWIKTIEQINNGLIKEDSPLFRIVKPIPLTKEILEKNGFKKDERNENYYKWNWYILEDNASYDMETGIVRIFNASNLTFCHPIGYVHELQNALRLCEVDKEITI